MVWHGSKAWNLCETEVVDMYRVSRWAYRGDLGGVVGEECFDMFNRDGDEDSGVEAFDSTASDVMSTDEGGDIEGDRQWKR